ncbi:Hyaluronan synthase 2 [Bienertia sinuspersici]
MSSLSQSSWLCSLYTIKTMQPTKKLSFHPTNPRMITFKPHKFSVFVVNNSKDETSSSSEADQTLEESKPNRVQLALEKAREYKKSLQLDNNQGSKKDPIGESAGIPVEKGSEYQQKKEIVGNGKSTTNVENENFSDKGDGGKEVVSEAVRLAMEKVEELEKNEGKVGDNKINEIDQFHGEGRGGEMEVSEAVKMAMGKAKEYKKNNGTIDSNSSFVGNPKMTELEGGSASKLGNASTNQDSENKEDLKLSSIDFAGLNFADKKKGRGLPPGLVPVAEPFPIDELPEVEILVGDASKFGSAATSESATSSQEEKDKAAKEARSRELIAAYKRKMGVNMDPNIKAECEKAEGGTAILSNSHGKVAFPVGVRCVMVDEDEALVMMTELHGLAALNWSICQDSLTRAVQWARFRLAELKPEEARVMYEKLQRHPNGEVSKKARQFMFSFEAMEMLKVTKSTIPRKNTGYQGYFEAFVEDEAVNTSGNTEEEKDTLNQAVLYIVFLASPILLLLLFVAIKRV